MYSAFIESVDNARYMTIWQRWKQTALHNKTLVFSSVIMAFGTLFYSGAAILQVWMFNRSSSQVERQTERLISAANTQGGAATTNADAAKSFALSADGIKTQTANAVEQFQRLADNGQRIIANNQQSFRQEQRPYLWVEPRGGFLNTKENTFYVFQQKEDKSGYIVAASVVVTNSGHSPAVNTQMPRTQFKIGPTEKSREEAKHFTPSYTAQRGGLLVVGSKVIVSWPQEISNDEFTHLTIDGTWTLYIVGGIQYRDIFHPTIEPYETTFAFS